jgi:hypothetical protein
MTNVGEKNPAARLTAQDVTQIRKFYAANQLGLRPLARLFGVDIKAIWNIVHGVTWKHVAYKEDGEIE